MDHGVELLTFLKKPRPREVEFCAQVSQSVHKISDDVGPAVWRIVAAPSECPQTCPDDTVRSRVSAGSHSHTRHPNRWLT